MHRSLLLLIWLSTAATCAGATPLVEFSGPQAPLARDLEVAMLAWNRATMVEAYRRVGRRDPSWDEPALQMLDTWALRFSGQGMGLSPEALSVLAVRLDDELGCDDPLVAYCCGLAYEAAGRDEAALDAYRRAVADFEASGYPAQRRAWACLRLARAFRARDGEQADAVPQLVDRAAGALLTALEAGQYADFERALIRHVLIADTGSPELDRRFRTAVVAGLGDRADTWYGTTLRGLLTLRQAWSAAETADDEADRGEALARSRRQLATAQELLGQAWRLAPEQPMAATWMITAATARESEIDPRIWFERAVAAEFDHQPAHRAYLTALQPQWGGSHDAMIAYGLECARTLRYDTDVPLQLVEALRLIFHDLDDPRLQDRRSALLADPELAKELEILVIGHLSHPRWADRSAWFRSLRVALNWHCGHQRAAIAEARELGDDLDPRPLASFGLEPETVLAPESIRGRATP